ncbi:16311_t:CDS:1, partial [Acaulospora colombiana]
RAAQSDPLPLLVFSHIPLARPDTASCGRLREGGTTNPPSKHSTPQISKGAGSGYQNLLGKDTSNWVLESLAPVKIFSADDHDYCEHVHSYNVHSTFALSGEEGKEGKKGEMVTLHKARETTIKGFSMNVKIRRPGFQLVSLWNPIHSDKEELDWETPKRSTVADALCLLPDQTKIYTHNYFPLIILTTLLIVWMNLWATSSGARGKDDSPLLFLSAPTSTSQGHYSDASSTNLLADQTEEMRVTGRTGSSGLTVRTTSSKPSPMQLHPTHGSEGSVPMSRNASPRSHSSNLEKEDDEEDGQYAHVRITDEEKGGGMYTPRTAGSAWTAASSPITERGGSSIGKSGSWEIGSWKRNGGSGFGRPRSPMFGLGITSSVGASASSPHLRPSSPWGSTFGLAQNEREREKWVESGQRAYSNFSIVGTGRGVWRYMRQWDWARSAQVMKRWAMGGRPISGTPLWKRVVWDGSM